MLTQKETKQIEHFAIELKKWSDKQSYNFPSRTKVQLSPTRRYKKEIFLLCAKTNLGAKVEKYFAELEQLHQEYESWRAKTFTEDNEEEFHLLIDSLKGTLYDLADTLNQIAQIYRDELSAETPEEKDQSKSIGKLGWKKALLWKLYDMTVKSVLEWLWTKIFSEPT